jgi:succinyldiaminopimelate transaminase
MNRRKTRLPDFPWDSLTEYAAKAKSHRDGIVDLSVGTPVDPVPERIQAALASVAQISGYPATHGTPALREAAVGALARRHGVVDVPPDAVLPTIGSKELIAWLPRLLGLGPSDTVVIPELAYPTYEVGALLAGTRIMRSDSIDLSADELHSAEPATKPDSGKPVPDGTRPAMVWLNSPANPSGKVLGAQRLREVVGWAREHDVIVVSDECYLGLGWETEPVSLLHPSVHGGRLDGLLAVHSLSKTANLAGYRAGFVTGDPALVSELLAVRKHAGMIVPRPVQEAMTTALNEDDLLVPQKERYRARRTVLKKALEGNGFRVDHSEAGLYLWATRGEDCWVTLDWLAQRGILVAPGAFYGPAGGKHVRVAMTATDERIESAAVRLSSNG